MTKSLPDRFIQRIADIALSDRDGQPVLAPDGEPVSMDQARYYEVTLCNDKRCHGSYPRLSVAVRLMTALSATKVGDWFKISGSDHEVFVSILNDPTPNTITINTPQGPKEVPDRQTLTPFEQRAYFKFQQVIMDAPTEGPAEGATVSPAPSVAPSMESPQEAVAN